jgi:hypothetical protein
MKTETLEEFIARGGKITVVTPDTQEVKQTLKQTSQGVPTFLSYDDVDLYYGDKKTSKKKTSVKSKETKIDISSLPEELRKKFFNVQEQEDDSEEQE